MHTTKFIRGMAITVGIVAGTTTAAGALAGGGIDSSPTVTVKQPPVPTTVTQYFIGPSTTAPLPHLDGANPILQLWKVFVVGLTGILEASDVVPFVGQPGKARPEA